MMGMTPDPQQFFTQRHHTYARFIRLVRYEHGLRDFFVASPLLRPDLRILDAGCGTGALTLAVREAMVQTGFRPAALHAFDLTPAMLDHFQGTLRQRGVEDIALATANVLDLNALPDGWTDYDLVVSASMLEYVPRERFVDALASLRSRLRRGGRFVLFMTRRNPLTRLLIGHWWQSNLYSAPELADAFHRAGFSNFTFRQFPTSAIHLMPWGRIVEAER